jgi:nitrogen-specific signal transduction histidine kinase
MARALADFQINQEKRDREICDALTKILELVKAYHAILVEMKEDYDMSVNKVFKDD